MSQVHRLRRVKDLIDLALLIRSGGLARKRTADAVRLTFERRRTHELPPALLEPPQDWLARFLALSQECHLSGDMDAVFHGVAEFFERMVQG
jgi:Nucleotidyl transferase AbiEii toxin, Type IV TA system